MSDIIKCHSGHETNKNLWDCPVCVQSKIDQLTKENERLKKDRIKIDGE